VTTAEYYAGVTDDQLRYRSKLIDNLVELGADALGSMLAELQAKKHESAHYYKGKFQALKEAAYTLFAIDSGDYRAQCMFVETVCRLDRQGNINMGK